MTKTCYRCKTEKSFSEFHKHKSHKDGLYDSCKPCTLAYNRSPERKLKNNARNLETQYQSKKRYPYLRNYNLKKKYGITLNQYNQMILDQNGLCAICEKKHLDCHNGLYVDHNHTTGKVRNLLCRDCNVGIGHFKESIILLKKASEYIMKHDYNNDQNVTVLKLIGEK